MGQKKCILITSPISLWLKRRKNKEEKKRKYVKEMQKTETLQRTVVLGEPAFEKDKAVILITVSLEFIGLA